MQTAGHLWSQAVAAHDLAETRQDSSLTTYDEPDADYLASRDADDAFQQYIANTTYASEDDGEESAIPQYLYTEDDSQQPSQEPVVPGSDNPSMSFTSSFTSGKRLRESHSPPFTSKKRTHSSTSRTHPSHARQSVESSTQGSSQSDSSKSYWVEAHRLKGKVYFRDQDGHELETKLKDWVEQTVHGTPCYYWQSTK